MTSSEDRPPLTRREARERERQLRESGSAQAEASADARSSDERSPITAPVAIPRFTESVREAAPEPASTSDAEIEPVSETLSALPEHTLTRRELRAMLQAQHANQQASQRNSAAAADDALVDDLTIDDRASLGHVGAPTAAPFESPVASATPTALPLKSAPVAATELSRATGSLGASEPSSDSESVVAASKRTSAPVLAGLGSTSGTATAPNALILPIMPSPNTATGPLAATGEILVTGSIELPHSLSTTGTHSAIHDSAEIDSLFDRPEDATETSTMMPVKASRAVSSHAAVGANVVPQHKTGGGKLPAILAGTAAILAAGVAGLIITGYALGLL